MNNVRSAFTALAGVLCFVGGQPAGAQTASTPSSTMKPAPGMMVKDTAGGIVGTVTKVGNGLVTVKTDKHEAILPISSFTPNKGALLFAMTQAQLDADVEKQDAAAAAMFKEGARVRGTGGVDAGTITALDADSVTLKLASGTSVRVPRSGIAAAADGLVVGMTAEQLEAAARPSPAKNK
jgi:preprotein translocase subunit YajC